MLNNELIFLILTYSDIFTLITNKNLNRSISNKYYTICHKKIIKNDYKINLQDVKLDQLLKQIHLSYLKKCIICHKTINCDMILLIHNILPTNCKCFLCYNYNCDCKMYLYGHKKCLKNFKKNNMNNSKIHYFFIKYLSNYVINGLSIYNRI